MILIELSKCSYHSKSLALKIMIPFLSQSHCRIGATIILEMSDSSKDTKNQ